MSLEGSSGLVTYDLQNSSETISVCIEKEAIIAKLVLFCFFAQEDKMRKWATQWFDCASLLRTLALSPVLSSLKIRACILMRQGYQKSNFTCSWPSIKKLFLISQREIV
jgi:hypothetical protein